MAIRRQVGGLFRRRTEASAQKELIYLRQELERLGHFPLAREIRKYLRHHASTDGVPMGYVNWYMNLMASELVNAIASCRPLRLACLWDPYRRITSPYSAVFIWDGDSGEQGFESDGEEEDEDDDDDEDEDEEEEEDEADETDAEMTNSNGGSSSRSDWDIGNGSRWEPEFVFTDSRAEDPGSEAHDPNDLDQHVSLEVRVENLDEITELVEQAEEPRLRVQRWLTGLCFFRRQPRIPAVFPWPSNLALITP